MSSSSSSGVIGGLLLFGVVLYPYQHPVQSPTVVLADDARAIKLTDRSGRKLLTTADLPTESTIAEGFGLANDRFVSAVLSVAGGRVAFAVAGPTHQWLGTYDLPSKDIRQLDFLFEGSVGNLVWSPDDQMLAAEVTPASGLATIRVYDWHHRQILVTLGKEDFTYWPLEAYDPQWSEDSSSFSYKTRNLDGQQVESHRYTIRHGR